MFWDSGTIRCPGRRYRADEILLERFVLLYYSTACPFSQSGRTCLDTIPSACLRHALHLPDEYCDVTIKCVHSASEDVFLKVVTVGLEETDSLTG